MIESVNEKLNIISTPLTQVQINKVQHLVRLNSASIVASDVYLDTDRGICKIDTFGRVDWIDNISTMREK